MQWKYFTRDEFKCKCGCETNLIQDDFISKLDRLRSALGFPLVISSGYRCPKHNREVSGTGDSGPHTTGRAADIVVERSKAFLLISIAANNGFTGIGVKQRGTGRYIHLDDLLNAPGQPRPTIWSY